MDFVSRYLRRTGTSYMETGAWIISAAQVQPSFQCALAAADSLGSLKIPLQHHGRDEARLSKPIVCLKRCRGVTHDIKSTSAPLQKRSENPRHTNPRYNHLHMSRVSRLSTFRKLVSLLSFLPMQYLELSCPLFIY